MSAPSLAWALYGLERRNGSGPFPPPDGPARLRSQNLHAQDREPRLMGAALDVVDRKILTLLRQDGRMSHAAIAKEVGLSGPAVHERVRKLEAKGVIAGYTAILDPEILDRNHVCFVMVTLSEGNEFAADDPIVARICDEPDVLEFHRIAGEDCYMIKIRTATNKDLERLLRRIRLIPGVARTRTTIVLSSELERPTIEVPVDDPKVEETV